MQSFEFHCPTEVVFGKSTEQKTAQEIKKFGGSRVFLIYGGGSAVHSGLIGRMKDNLREADLPYEMMGGVQPNPRLSFAREAVKRAQTFGADFILAVGGGSVIDTAKAVAIGLADDSRDIWDYWCKKAPVTGAAPVGVVLTIPASGSETSDSAVLTDEESKRKRGLSTDFNRPRFAVLNPELTYTLPPFQLSCGITDMLMHTLDRYFTVDCNNQLTDEIAEAVMRIIIRNGQIAHCHPHDYDAMSELMWCGSISHNGLTGLGNEKDFSVHQLGHELSAKFDIAHGASLSAVWDSWANYASPSAPQRFARYAENVWGVHNGSDEEKSRSGIALTIRFFRFLGMPTCFSELQGVGIQPDAVLHQMADSCMYSGKRTVGTFCKLDIPAAHEIYQNANY
ncbi:MULTISPECIES: iron-containing alcohol dehydrogenase [Caproicibacterium]|uniref:Iron-containing alcohol dehydrogenase n=1 Tax=Caproicibacterium lactatifermentans TaxID=2666138 RepID=A0A859DQZ8_9FIRM|nr:iron-containing alcohol dehydrogenase [Caproicibacterium lactatifermentans]ARP49961.1 NADH-dependent alcohol dehydrogenase [Ruminococcaceae bacterium CPB6]MDD4807961.1 iron-containing alcohol dehydrogenase [Oscillospiraceae bacterium]QKN24318.1 iron-containing alcohol dehydrogenase [Caproicibacterium lactatifermentans]QKO30669.1 iron-containing alcohol dehydrogenase [Caproicibacterium lactatifermentans]